jgi:hypothetical protein
MREMAAVAGKGRMLGKERKANGRGMTTGVEASQELNH